MLTKTFHNEVKELTDDYIEELLYKLDSIRLKWGMSEHDLLEEMPVWLQERWNNNG